MSLCKENAENDTVNKFNSFSFGSFTKKIRLATCDFMEQKHQKLIYSFTLDMQLNINFDRKSYLGVVSVKCYNFHKIPSKLFSQPRFNQAQSFQLLLLWKALKRSYSYTR